MSAQKAIQRHAVELRALTKDYGKTRALHGIDLNIERGSVFGLIGPNGAGKTTMMRLMLDIIRASSGTVRVLGADPRVGGPELRKRIGYLPGELRIDSRRSGRDFLGFCERISGPVASGTVERLADRLDVDLGRPVRSLSKGNKQKLGLIQAFMHTPELLVLDEPTSGLDPLAQHEVQAMVRDASADGQTVLLSSHVLSEVEQAADTVAILRAGRIVAVSTVAELREAAIRHLRIGVPASDADTVRAALSRVPGMSEIAVEPGVAGSPHATIRAVLEGELDPLVRALAEHHLVDLTVREPELEESVLRYYRDQETKGEARA